MEEEKIVKQNNKSKIEQKRCPDCGSGDIQLNPITGKLRCNYCKHEFEPEKVEGFVENINELKGTVIGAGAQNIQEMPNSIITCKCSGCGAEITLNTNELAFTKCHWCHTGLSLNDQVPSGIVPDAILPFKVSKEEAFEDMKKLVEKKSLFAKEDFKNNFKIENLRGVYLPYMMLDVNGHAVFKGIGGKIVNTHTHTYTRQRKTYGRDRKVTYEKYDCEREEYDIDLYDTEREFDIQIKNLLETTDSKQLNWKKVEKPDRANFVLTTLMPFDVANCVKWDANYLNGYSLEKRDTNIGDISDNMKLKAKDVARHKINKDLDYNAGINWKKEEFDINGQQWKAVYLPVWIYSYVQETKKGPYTYFIAENARTKEMNYTIPLNLLRFIIFTLICFALPILVIAWIGMLLSYNHFDERNRHEKDTKTKITNINRKDEFIKHKKRQNSNVIKNANNKRIEGDN